MLNVIGWYKTLGWKYMYNKKENTCSHSHYLTSSVGCDFDSNPIMVSLTREYSLGKFHATNSSSGVL